MRGLSQLCVKRQRPGSFVGLDAEEPSVTETDRRKIAIIDDDYAVRDSIRLLLEVMGHCVETFASATDFLKAATRKPSCLILDYRMPEMTGLELAKRLRADGDSIPILLITGSGSTAAIVARASKVGVVKVLTKPPAEQDLLDFINSHPSKGKQPCAG
jgi:two-component system, LuxR family, response regulator FixJ